MELPKGWVYSKLSGIGQIVSGGTPSTKQDSYWNGDIAWITPADLTGYGDKYISYGKRNITQMGLAESSAQLMPAGSVHFSSRAPIGYIVISRNKICTNQGFKSIVPYVIDINEYLYYFLKEQVEKIKARASGTTFKEISGTEFGNTIIPLPPLAEQHRIVAKIDALFSKLDKGVEMLQTMRQQLQMYRQAVLKWAFEGKEWKRVTIERFLSKKIKPMATGPFGTMLKKDEHKSTGVPVLGIENIGKGVFQPGNKIFVTPEKANYLKAFVLHKNDVIISRSGTVGELCLVPPHMDGALLSTNLMRVTLDDTLIVPKYFIHLFLSKGVVIDQVKELCKGSTRDFLNQTILKQIVFPLPSLKEQAQIVAAIESRLSVCDKLESIVDESLAKVEALRQSILKKAFAGQLVPQDPNDEPASILLERIKAEQKHISASVKTKGGRKNG